MTLIVDSGSTKTIWMNAESCDKVTTEGLNPHFTTEKQFATACREIQKQYLLPTAHNVLYFYGAGCGNEQQRLKIRKWLAKYFGECEIHVGSDLLGACRATCGNQPGLVGILGTGSNACYYDGQSISRQAPSLGYILGDHGAANHVGRMLLQDYLTDKMPDELMVAFRDTFEGVDEEWLEAVYHRPHANRYLASFAPFATARMSEPYCNGCLCGALEDWYCYQLSELVLTAEVRVLHVVGSFGHALRPLLTGFCRDNGMELGRVLTDPMEGLRNYHLNN